MQEEYEGKLDEIYDEVVETGVRNEELMSQYFSMEFNRSGIYNANYFDTVDDVFDRHKFWFGLASWDKYKDGAIIRQLISEYLDNLHRKIKEDVFKILDDYGYSFSFLDNDTIYKYIAYDVTSKYIKYNENKDYFINLINEWKSTK